MADLPSSRVIPSRAFLRAGTYFCGPFLITPRRGRGVRPVKMKQTKMQMYITKAVHLEFIGDLSTDVFLHLSSASFDAEGNPPRYSVILGPISSGVKHVLKLWSSEAIGRYLANNVLSGEQMFLRPHITADSGGFCEIKEISFETSNRMSNPD
ncbi:hypothetical protein HNY73_013992 [Argiope bruennichi]|uniref:Uncharacterized protein n=1 Tax=Argiope bruennichi TaxID=94029 RepID=A0A8T0EMW3_ARGBR|nr:hypothetical protein HNY73_013992 [Argiope bruennichi]